MSAGEGWRHWEFLDPAWLHYGKFDFGSSAFALVVRGQRETQIWWRCPVSPAPVSHLTADLSECVCSWTWAWAIVVVWQKPLPILWCPLQSFPTSSVKSRPVPQHTHSEESLPAGAEELHLHYDGRQIKYIPLHTKGTQEQHTKCGHTCLWASKAGFK